MNQHWIAWALLGAMCALCVPSVAVAQDKFEGPLKDQLEEYWSVERDLPVIKNRLFERAETIELGLYTGLMSSDPFFFYLPIGLHAGYYLSDGFAIELSGQYSLPFNTELTDFFETQRQDGFDADLHTGDRFVFRTNVVAKWHPIYGKIAAFQRKLAHFDFNLVGGLGVVGYNRPDPNRTASEFGVAPELVFGAGLSFFINKNLTIRLDGRGYLYAGPEFETSAFTTDDEGNKTEHGFFDRLTVPSEFLLGVSYSL